MSLMLVFALSYLNRKYHIMDWIPPWILYSTASLFVVIMTRKIHSFVTKRNQMKERIKRKRKVAEEFKVQLEQSLLIDGQLVTETREDIVKLPVKVLVQRLQDGILSCVDVMKAYQAKALEITKELNCVTEFIKEAEEWAREMDKASKKGPLHGLPISIKDNVSITGYDSTTGISTRIDLPAAEDAALLAALRGLGAIPFCITNVPQTMLSFGCSNPIWGLTRNPHNKDRTPGGSSGGEGCIIGAGGSPLGVGSDIGGSARAPAAFCGIASIKPTSVRFSYKGFTRSAKGCIGVPSVPGILARDVETIIFVSQLLLDNSHHAKYDPDVLPVPWDQQLFSSSRKLRIGFYDDDGFFPTTPGMKRAVQMARESLEKMGHKLVPFRPTKVDYVLNSFTRIIQADGAKYLLTALSDEHIDPVLMVTYIGMKLPYFVKWIFAPLMRLIAPRLVPNFLGAGGYPVRYSYQLWDELQRKNEYRAEFMAAWRQNELDLCIAPPFACPAPLSKDIGRLLPAGTYTVVYNFLDLPVGIVPVSKENEDDQAKLDDYNHSDLVCKLVKKTTKGATGMPLCVQVIGKPYQEELVLKGMQILVSSLQSSDVQ